MNPKARIVKVTRVDGVIEYTIQQRHWLFRWKWVSAWLNSWAGANCTDTFASMEEAQKHMCYFDGSKQTVEVLT